jgi:peptide/nickel transport system permease protein
MARSSFWAILVGRLLQGILVVFTVVTIVFVVSRVVGDPIRYLASDESTAEEIEALQDLFGLNDPLYEQYADFVWDLARLEMGNSFLTGRSAVDEVRSRSVKTLQLGFAALLFSLVLGVPLGVIAALRRGTPIDWFARFLAVIGQATPNFFLGLLAIFFFAVKLGWLPTGGGGGVFSTNMIMPVVVLGMLTSAGVMRLTRSAMIDVMGTDFIRTARAKGLRERTVIRRHALRHALLPVATILGIQLGRLIAGSVIVETVFAWPGVGRLTISAIQGSDYPVVQLSIMVIASTIVLANIVVDLSYRLIDPRIRAGNA